MLMKEKLVIFENFKLKAHLVISLRFCHVVLTGINHSTLNIEFLIKPVYDTGFFSYP